MTSFHDQVATVVAGILADPTQWPAEMTAALPQVIAQNPVAVGGAPGTAVAYTQATSNVTIAGTSEGSATHLLDTGPINYQANPLLIRAWGQLTFGTGYAVGDTITLELFDEGSVVGVLGQFVVQESASTVHQPFHVVARIVPVPGSHQYRLDAWHSGVATNMALEAGVGGAGTLLPAGLLVTLAGV